jgi:hypothetical protein
MNITIKTLTVQVESKEVPLTKAMVNQLDYMPVSLPRDWKWDDIKCIGSVSLTDAIWYLYNTPDGLRRSRGHICTLSESHIQPPRLILTK